MENNLLLNTGKTKELIIDFRRSQDEDYTVIFISVERVERVERGSSIRFLGVYIADDLTWATNATAQLKKAQHWLFFLRTLKKERNHTKKDSIRPSLKLQPLLRIKASD